MKTEETTGAADALDLAAAAARAATRNRDRLPYGLLPVGLFTGALGLVVVLALVGAWVAVLYRTPWGRDLMARCDEERLLWPLHEEIRTSLEATGLDGFRVELTPGAAGMLVAVTPARGVPDAAVLARADVLASDLGAWRVVPVPSDRHGAALLLVQMEDPLLSVLAGTAWAPAEAGVWDLSRPIPTGTREDGGSADVGLWAQTMLVGGSPGSGKSVFGWLPLLGAALDPTAILVIVDLKPHGIETAPLGSRADYAAHDSFAAHAVFKRVWRLIDERNAVLRAAGLEKVPTDARTQFPPVVIVVDEAAELKHDDEGKEALALLQRIVAVGRASGVSVLLLTQKPDGDTIPTNLRDLFAQRVCFRVGNRAQAETVLGVLPDGVAPWEISTNSPGIGFLRGLDGDCGRFRSFFIDRPEIVSLASTAARERGAWIHRHPDAVLELPPVALASVSADEKPRGPRRRR